MEIQRDTTLSDAIRAADRPAERKHGDPQYPMPSSREICEQGTFLYAGSQEPVSCISSRFDEKDFVSEHPLHTTSQPQSVGLAFFLSGRIAALDMLRKCNFVRRGPERRKGTAHMIRKELEKEKASRKDVHLALCVEKLSSAKNSKPLSVRVARCR